MKILGPDHPITIAPKSGRVIVRFGGVVVADSEAALELREANYPPVLYIPRGDWVGAFYHRTTHHSHCPYKGDASYFDLEAGGKRADNAVWSYENPFPAMAEIKDHVAFYSNKVEITVEA